MRKKIVAGNWKMNKLYSEGIELAEKIKQLSTNQLNSNVELIIAPPFIHLSEIKKKLLNGKVKLAAQNCSHQKNGAFTGEISAQMLSSIGVEYVIVGHSERREYQLESNVLILDKIYRCLENNLKPIVCIGEKLAERESGNYFNIIEEQIEESIFLLNNDEFSKIIIAYEPVWAIGTGLNATKEQAQEIHSYIREKVFLRFGEELSSNVPILYGGSCKPDNANSLFSQPDVDGGLIGGASLKADDFLAIANSF